MSLSPYKLARKILPQTWQDALGNRHVVKRKTLDPLVFNFHAQPRRQQALHDERTPAQMPEALLEANPHIEPIITPKYRRAYQKPQHEVIMRVDEPVWIDPKTGWAMGRGNQLYASLCPFGDSPYLPVPHYKHLFTRTPAAEYHNVIVMRSPNEDGYYHFYADFISNLYFLKEHGVDLSEYHLLISGALARTQFASHLLQSAPIFQQLKGIYLQEDAWAKCTNSLFVHTHSTALSSAFKQMATDMAAAAPAQIETERKVFIIRAQHRRRHLRNTQAISDILTPLGFETIDADEMSLPQQQQLFAQARHVVGVHGAGLTNAIYRAGKPMSLYELHYPPTGRVGFNFSYHRLAAALGFDYGAMAAERPDPIAFNCEVDAARFEQRYTAFFNEVTSAPH